MRRKLTLITTVVFCTFCLALIVTRIINHLYVPAAWSQLQRWVATATPGELLTGNAELTSVDGRRCVPLRTQSTSMPFLFSDNPEYLYNESVDKGLAYMRLSRDPHVSRQPIPFGVGFNHINDTTNPATGKLQAQTISIVIRLLPAVREGSHSYVNTQKAIVHLVKGAYGVSTGKSQILAGRQCAINWFQRPNVPPTSLTLAPGEARVIFTRTMAPNASMNAMFDLDATNAFFVEVYVVFGKIADYRNIAYAPYGMTIGTASGTGRYWKRILRPAPGTPPFDASDSRHTNETRLRFEKLPAEPGQQYLIDETWDQRPENSGKELIRKQGGERRPFKGDYNVEYTISLPVRAGSGVPCWFGVLLNQQPTPGIGGKQISGMYTGAAQTAQGDMVCIPNDPNTLLRPGATGVLLERACVSNRTPTENTFKWMLPGGSYCDQDFVFIPLPR